MINYSANGKLEGVLKGITNNISLEKLEKFLTKIAEGNDTPEIQDPMADYYMLIMLTQNYGLPLTIGQKNFMNKVNGSAL